MRIFVVEDEPILLNAAARIIKETEPSADIMTFLRGAEVLEVVSKGQILPDVLFSDIEMPGINGLELAVRLKEYCPAVKIIFVTGYPQYALEAFRIHAHGYIMKPLQSDRIREELDHLKQMPLPPTRDENKLQVRCFGNFDIFWHDEPVSFSRKQTKEMFAYLIDREGGSCALEDVAAILWEEDVDMRNAKNRIRVLINDLKTTLQKIGQEKIIVRKSGWIAVRRDMVDCDYYRMLDGDVTSLNDFNGEYMKQYSWAELTTGKLYFRFVKKS